ncbi:MAG: SH3 domain-containing protein [Cyanobacteria bacterium J06559_3]
MTIKQAYLALLLLGLTAYNPTANAGEIAPVASQSIALNSTEPIFPPAVERQATLVSSETDAIVFQQTGEYQASNPTEKCFAVLAYDPGDTAVNLRDQPDGDIVASLPNFTLLSTEPGMAPALIDAGWNYVHVAAQNQPGFISGYVWEDRIRRTYYQVKDPQDTYANLRESPDGSVVSILPNGTEVRFVGEKDTWTHVQLANGQMGYVATSLLTDPSCF